MLKADAAVTETSELKTLEQVFRWAVRRDEPLAPRDVIVQDEYTHDVLFEADDGSTLAFDAT